MPNIELDHSEYRLKGAKRIKPLKKQPTTPLGNPAYFKARFSFMAVICGIWAACVITWAHANPEQDALTIAIISLGPSAILFGLMLLNDE